MTTVRSMGFEFRLQERIKLVDLLYLVSTIYVVRNLEFNEAYVLLNQKYGNHFPIVLPFQVYANQKQNPATFESRVSQKLTVEQFNSWKMHICE